MKKIRSEIITPKPRVFKEVARILLEDGDKIREANGYKVIEIGKPPFQSVEVNAKRYVRRSGKPYSNWLFNLRSYVYILEEE